MTDDTEINDAVSKNETPSGESHDNTEAADGDDASLLVRGEPDQKLHERNIDFLTREIFAFRRLKSYEPNAELRFLDNGEPTVELGNVSLYGDDGALTHTQRQLDKYWSKPDRVTISPPDGQGLDGYSKPYLQNILKKILEEDISVYHKQQTVRAGHVVVFGVGLGAHLFPLLEKTQCQNILLVEPNMEFIYHSTFVFDWEKFYKTASAQNCNVHLFTMNDSAGMVRSVRHMLVSHNVMTVDGAVMYEHYKNKFFDSAKDKLRVDLNSFFMALGYTEDEFFMTSHTYMNYMKYDHANLFLPCETPIRDIPVFIVGGGPSKDAHFDVLRANQDKAIIMSCGSALSTLLDEGIVPDFHFQLERGTDWYGVVKRMTDGYDVSNTCLVASSTVDPRLRELFGDTVYFYRPALSPYKMFGQPSKAVLLGCDPQVGNAAFAFADLLNFENIYLFGMDLGSRDPALHHSRNSAPMRGEFKHHNLTTELPATLGGIAYTTDHLLLVRDNIENMILAHKKPHNVFNCSDGIVIKGTVPKIPRKLSLPPLRQPKQTYIDKLKSGFLHQSKEDFTQIWTDLDLRARVDRIRNTFQEIFDQCPDLVEDDLFLKLHKEVSKENTDIEATPIVLFKGNVHMMMMAAWYYITHVQEQDREKLYPWIRDEFMLQFDKMIADMNALLDELEAWLEHGVYPLDEEDSRPDSAA